MLMDACLCYGSLDNKAIISEQRHAATNKLWQITDVGFLMNVSGGTPAHIIIVIAQWVHFLF